MASNDSLHARDRSQDSAGSRSFAVQKKYKIGRSKGTPSICSIGGSSVGSGWNPSAVSRPPLSSTLVTAGRNASPLKGPSRYLLANLVRDHSVPRTHIAGQLMVLEDVRQGGSLLRSQPSLNEADATAYIEKSPLMRKLCHQAANSQALSPARIAAANNSPRPSESTENTPMFHKTPARFLVPSRTTLLPTAAAKCAGPIARTFPDPNLTPAAATEMAARGGGGHDKNTNSNRYAKAVPPVRGAGSKGPFGGIGVFRPSDADLGYLPPRISTGAAAVGMTPEKRPQVASSSDREEFVFKRPELGKGQKRKEAPKPVDQLQSEANSMRYLVNWLPRLRNKRLFVEGDIVDLSQPAPERFDKRWTTSKIVRRVSANIVGTKGSDYVLEGDMVLRPDEEQDTSMPCFVMHRFRHGFPEDWQNLVTFWIRIDEEKKRHAENMSFIWNSTINTNLSFATVAEAFGNMSNITMGQNASQFLSNTTVRPQDQSRWLNQLPGENSRSRSPLKRIVEEPVSACDLPAKSSRPTDVVDDRLHGQAARGQADANSSEPETEVDEEAEITRKEQERKSRSKTRRQNKNAAASGQQTSAMDATMSMQDFSVLRAKTYERVTIVAKKKNYSCHFCQYLTPLFGELKHHIKENHLEDGKRRKGADRPRSQTAESSLQADTFTPAAAAASRRPRARSDESLLATPAVAAARENQGASQLAKERRCSSQERAKKHCQFDHRPQQLLKSADKAKKRAQSGSQSGGSGYRRQTPGKSTERAEHRTQPGGSAHRRNTARKSAEKAKKRTQSSSQSGGSGRSRSTPGKSAEKTQKSAPAAEATERRKASKKKQSSPPVKKSRNLDNNVSRPDANSAGLVSPDGDSRDASLTNDPNKRGEETILESHSREAIYEAEAGKFLCIFCPASAFKRNIDAYRHLKTMTHGKRVAACGGRAVLPAAPGKLSSLEKPAELPLIATAVAKSQGATNLPAVKTKPGRPRKIAENKGRSSPRTRKGEDGAKEALSSATNLNKPVDSNRTDAAETADTGSQVEAGKRVRKQKQSYVVDNSSLSVLEGEEVLVPKQSKKQKKTISGDKDWSNTEEPHQTKKKKSAIQTKESDALEPLKRKQKCSSSQAKPVQDSEADVPLLEELIVKPRTAKDRQRNAEIFRAQNRNHEDDLFTGRRPELNLLNFNEDTDSENEISIHSARTPVEKYLVKTKTVSERTPALLAEPSPESPKKQLQTYSFVHSRIEENKKLAKEKMRHKKIFSLALTEKMKSQATKTKLLEKSCQVIQNLTQAQDSQHSARPDEEDDDWYSEGSEVDHNSRLDEQAGLISALTMLH